MPPGDKYVKFCDLAWNRLTVYSLCAIMKLVAHPMLHWRMPVQTRGEGNQMSEVRVRENESLESALRRFKRKTARDGIIAEARKREHYEKPSVKRKKKAEAARKRKY